VILVANSVGQPSAHRLRAPGLRQWRWQYSAPQAAGGHETRPYEMTRRQGPAVGGRETRPYGGRRAHRRIRRQSITGGEQPLMSEITVRGARLHNLKNVSFSIPKNQLVVFTGLSGSGKSTMAFDTLHKEGQRQYMESLGMVTYESRPPVDAIVGLSPSISVDQHNGNRSPRSTVGTATEVYTYLPVLFARTGHPPCPQCGAPLPEHGMG
jgi:hypothetical protein